MTKLKLGQPSPEFSLQSADGGIFALNDMKDASQHTLLVFLRHLG